MRKLNVNRTDTIIILQIKYLTFKFEKKNRFKKKTTNEMLYAIVQIEFSIFQTI